MNFSWIAALPNGVLYGLISIPVLIVAGAIVIVLFRGIKYKRTTATGAKVEVEVEGIIDTPDKPEETTRIAEPAAPVNLP